MLALTTSTRTSPSRTRTRCRSCKKCISRTYEYDFTRASHVYNFDRKEGGLMCYSKQKNAQKYHPRPSMKSLSAYGIHLWQR